MEDFPHFGNAWRAAARCREIERTDCLSRLTKGMDYQHYAAASIQRRYRLYVDNVPQAKRESTLQFRTRQSQEKKLRRASMSDVTSGRSSSWRTSTIGSSRSSTSRGTESGSSSPKGKLRRSCSNVSDSTKSSHRKIKVQTETDHGSSRGGGGGSAPNTPSSSSTARVQSELRFELRTGLANFKQEMFSMMRDCMPDGGKSLDPALRRTNSGLTSASSDIFSGAMAIVPCQSSRSLGGATSSGLELPNLGVPDSARPSYEALEEENRRLRAVVADQKRQLDVVKELLQGSSLSSTAPT